jgi:hypothetical protein
MSAELYFRWENSETGGLEFRPVYNFPPVDESAAGDRSWGGRGESSVAGLRVSAQSLLPGYPFMKDYCDSSNEDDLRKGPSGSGGGDRSVVGWDAAAADAASLSSTSTSSSSSSSSSARDNLGRVRAVATANGGLSAPLLYGSVVVGLLVCYRFHEDGLPQDEGAGSSGQDGCWDPTEVRRLHQARSLNSGDKCSQTSLALVWVH